VHSGHTKDKGASEKSANMNLQRNLSKKSCAAYVGINVWLQKTDKW